MDYIKSKTCSIRQKSQFIRKLYNFSKKIAPPVFIKVIQRALRFQVTSMDTIDGIINNMLKTTSTEDKYLCIPENLEYENRKSYQEGRFSKENDISIEDDDAEKDNEE